jgi:predicted enzyme related to lactoylglutathione lyase
MEVDKYDEGVPSWVDLGTGDIEAAATFYAGLFGWESPELPPEAGGYRICTLRGRPVAGLGPQMNPGPPVWATYVNTADADAVAERVTAHGGQVLAAPFDVLDAGRMGVFADPSGAVFSAWQPNTHQGAGLVNEPGTYSWSELLATDAEGALTFYPAVFGWGVNKMPPTGAPLQYVEWKLGDRSVGGMLPKPDTMPAGALGGVLRGRGYRQGRGGRRLARWTDRATADRYRAGSLRGSDGPDGGHVQRPGHASDPHAGLSARGATAPGRPSD